MFFQGSKTTSFLLVPFFDCLDLEPLAFYTLEDPLFSRLALQSFGFSAIMVGKKRLALAFASGDKGHPLDRGGGLQHKEWENVFGVEFSFKAIK